MSSSATLADPPVTGIDACRRVRLPSHVDARGGLTFVESMRDVPFRIERVYYLYDVAPGQARGAHAHKELEQVFIALAGSFEITLDDGRRRETYRLSQPDEGLYLGPMIWRDLTNFSAGAVCLVLASAGFDERDYVREYELFRKLARGHE